MVAAVTLPARSFAAVAASAVLFDLDGVLVDSRQMVEQAWLRWADEQQLEAGEVLAVIHGRRGQDSVRLLTPHLDPVQQVQRIRGYEAEGEGDGLAAMPGALECVSFARRGRWAVVTSGGRELAAQRLAAAGLPVPEVLVTGDDVKEGKPDPEPYLRAATALGVPAAECVVIEDAPAGVLAGQRAGMTVLAVTTTHPATELTQADQVFSSMDEVARYLRDQARSDSPRV
jgi:sugar-phosphatase